MLQKSGKYWIPGNMVMRTFFKLMFASHGSMVLMSCPQSFVSHVSTCENIYVRAREASTNILKTNPGDKVDFPL